MSKSTVKVDQASLIDALARSTNMARVLQKTAERIGDRAVAIATTEAYDEGDYARGFKSFAVSANALRGWINSVIGREYKSRRRNAKAYSPALEGEYLGAVGVVANTDYKALWIEYGTVKTPPKQVLQRAALEFGADAGGVR